MMSSYALILCSHNAAMSQYTGCCASANSNVQLLCPVRVHSVLHWQDILVCQTLSCACKQIEVHKIAWQACEECANKLSA